MEVKHQFFLAGMLIIFHKILKVYSAERSIQPMIIAYDGGHESIKIKAGPDKEKMYNAILGEVRSEIMQNGAGQIETGEGEWFVGETAQTYSHSLITGNEESWALSKHYRALLLFGVSEFVSPETGSIVVDLITALPISDYRRHKQEFIDSLMGTHLAVRPNRRDLQVNIRKVHVTAQGLPPAQPYMRDDITGGTLDIGSRNTNAIRWNGSTVESAGSSELGATQLLVDIAQQIQEQSGRQYTPFEIVEILAGKREARSFGEPFDATGIISYLVEEYAESLISSVAEIHGNAADLDKFPTFGGGALLVGEEIKKRYPQAFIVDDPQMASVRAMFQYGKVRFR